MVVALRILYCLYGELDLDGVSDLLKSYYTERGRLHTYTPGGGKVNPEKLMRHYTIG